MPLYKKNYFLLHVVALDHQFLDRELKLLKPSFDWFQYPGMLLSAIYLLFLYSEIFALLQNNLLDQ